MKTRALLTFASLLSIAGVAVTLFSAQGKPKGKGKNSDIPVTLTIVNDGIQDIVGDEHEVHGNAYDADLLQGTLLRMSFDAGSGRTVGVNLEDRVSVLFDPPDCAGTDPFEDVASNVFLIIAPIDADPEQCYQECSVLLPACACADLAGGFPAVTDASMPARVLLNFNGGHQFRMGPLFLSSKKFLTLDHLGTHYVSVNCASRDNDDQCIEWNVVSEASPMNVGRLSRKQKRNTECIGEFHVDLNFNVTLP